MVYILVVMFLHRGLLVDTPRLYVDPKPFSNYAQCAQAAERWRATSNDYHSAVCQQVSRK